MLVAGTEIDTEHVTRLIVMLREEYYLEAARTLEAALFDGAAEIGLTIRERTAALDVLDDPPPGSLSRLRDVLVEEHAGRTRVGPA